MRNKLIYLSRLLMVSLVMIVSHTSFAITWTCKPLSSFPVNKTVSINLTSYAGNDIPIGGTIYRASVKTAAMGGGCKHGGTGSKTDKYTYYRDVVVTNAPAGPPFLFSGMSVSGGSGPIYPTNISGVGIAMVGNDIKKGDFISNTPITTGRTITDTENNSSADIMNSTIVLVKTGPIASGSQINASSFPTYTYRLPAQSGYLGLPATLGAVNFTGTINFVTATCTTPDVNVEMGSHSVANSFTSLGSTTPWVDASIILQNCPTFSGYYSDRGYQSVAWNGSTATGGVRAANMMTVSLSPTTGVIDNTNGVIAVDNTGSLAQAATGVGIQLGYTPDNYAASPTSPKAIWKSGVKWNITPPNNGLKSFKVPLAARYFQTSKKVTAGPANAKVTFNIDYK